MSKLTLRSKVEYVLENWPQTQDDDQLLILYVWWNYQNSHFIKGNDGELWIKAKDTLVLEKPYSIRRMRQLIQKEGYFRGTKYKKRIENSENVRQTINTSDAEKYLS